MHAFMQDGIHLPFENVLHYDSFSVRIAEEKLPNLVSILQVLVCYLEVAIWALIVTITA
jgi:hypothetical protein